MKKIIWIITVALLTLTACSSDDDNKQEPKDELTVEKLAGLWIAEYDQSATEDGITWTRVVEDFLFRANGTGYWEIYLLDANKLVGADGNRDTDATHYTISGNTVYKGPFAGGMAVATFDDEHVYEKALPTYTISGDKIYKGPFAGGIVAFTIVREEE